MRIRRKRAGIATKSATILALLLAPWSTAKAGPHLEVRGESRFEVEATPALGSLAVSGALVDDAGHAVGEAAIAVAFVADDGSALDARSCDKNAPPLVPKPEHAWGLTTQVDGGFCARAASHPGTTRVTLSWPGTRLVAGTRTELSVDASRRTVTLAFDPEPRVLWLGEGAFVLDAVARAAGEEGSVSAAGLPLKLSDERGAPLGSATTDALGSARFVIFADDATARATPGPGSLRLDFDGDARDAKASKVVATERRVRVKVVAHDVDTQGAARGTDEDDGVGLDLDVTSVMGDPIPGGSVEGLWGGAVAGAAPVALGRAHLVMRWTDGLAGSAGQPASIEVRYVPELPWYVAGSPTVLTLAVRHTATLRRLAVLAGGLAIFAWFFTFRTRGLKAPQPPKAAPGFDATADLPRIEVIAAHDASDSARSWEGQVVDAHDGSQVPDAVVSIERASFGSLEVIARTRSDPSGHFVLPSIDAKPGDRLAAEGPLHTRFVRPAPPRGILEVALVSRRRALLRGLVDWARKKGAPFATSPEPTPAHVQRVAGTGSPTGRWASAVERAAFGSRPVDAEIEMEVERLGHKPEESTGGD